MKPGDESPNGAGGASPRRRPRDCEPTTVSPEGAGQRWLLVIGTLAFYVAAMPLQAQNNFPDAKDPGQPPSVSQADILASLARLDASEQAALAKDPGLLKQVVQLTLVQRLLLNEAGANKWDERPEVQAKMDRARDAALAESWLQSVAEPPPDYPCEEEIKAAWEARKASFAAPRRYRLSQIFIACPKTADKAAKAKAEAKLAAVKKKLTAYREDFSTIARAESDESVSAAHGGEIGWLSDEQIQPELRPQITRLLKHEVSAPVRLNDGWHILKCLDKREAGTPPLEEVRAKLVAQLRADRMKANSEARVARLLKENPVHVSEAALAGALNPKSK